MPLTQKHVDKSRANERLALSFDLSDPIQIDWAIIVTFYAALHSVEAYFATKGKHSKDHKQRDSSIQNDPNTSGIFNEYVYMKTYSINARHLDVTFTSETVQKMREKLQTINAHLAPLL